MFIGMYFNGGLCVRLRLLVAEPEIEYRRCDQNQPRDHI
jgi:hypothetical protein